MSQSVPRQSQHIAPLSSLGFWAPVGERKGIELGQHFFQVESLLKHWRSDPT